MAIEQTPVLHYNLHYASTYACVADLTIEYIGVEEAERRSVRTTYNFSSGAIPGIHDQHVQDTACGGRTCQAARGRDGRRWGQGAGSGAEYSPLRLLGSQ